MIDIDAKIKELQKSARESYKKLRSDEHRETVALANEIEAAMRGKGFDATASDTGYSVSVSATLAGKQALKQIKPFLKMVAATREYSPARYNQQAASGYVTWSFYSKHAENSQTLQFTIWLGESVSCKRVATGHMTEEYEVVCESVPDDVLNGV